MTRIERRRVDLRAVVLTLALAFAAVGCGVRAQSTAQRIAARDVPFGLTQAHAPGTTTSTPTAPHAFTLYFLAGDHLVPVARGKGQTASPETVLKALAAGPNGADSDVGLRSLLSPDLEVDAVSVAGNTITIDVTGQFASDTSLAGRRLALAQLVFTATEIPGVSHVNLRLDGQTAEIPDANGQLTRGYVSRSDFRDVTVTD